ncbi:hypothetical protein JF66_22840 [Cryobacterium sp. MLB-32]|nr:hypothetical protein JF66_22840 [Cryobacterium sp. MLB-32]
MQERLVRFKYASSEVGKDRVRETCICTLLGPEGPEHSMPLGVGLTFPLDLFLLASIAGVKGYRPYFENYTVDASILNLIGLRFDKLQRSKQLDHWSISMSDLFGILNRFKLM